MSEEEAIVRCLNEQTELDGWVESSLERVDGEGLVGRLENKEGREEEEGGDREGLDRKTSLGAGLSLGLLLYMHLTYFYGITFLAEHELRSFQMRKTSVESQNEASKRGSPSSRSQGGSLPSSTLPTRRNE